jgi:hypothetical protein
LQEAAESREERASSLHFLMPGSKGQKTFEAMRGIIFLRIKKIPPGIL